MDGPFEKFPFHLEADYSVLSTLVCLKCFKIKYVFVAFLFFSVKASQEIVMSMLCYKPLQ